MKSKFTNYLLVKNKEQVQNKFLCSFKIWIKKYVFIPYNFYVFPSPKNTKSSYIWQLHPLFKTSCMKLVDFGRSKPFRALLNMVKTISLLAQRPDPLKQFSFVAGHITWMCWEGLYSVLYGISKYGLYRKTKIENFKLLRTCQ